MKRLKWCIVAVGLMTLFAGSVEAAIVERFVTLPQRNNAGCACFVDSTAFGIKQHTTSSTPDTLAAWETSDVFWGTSTAPATVYSAFKVWITGVTGGWVANCDSVGVAYQVSDNGTNWSAWTTPVYESGSVITDECFFVAIPLDADLQTVASGGAYGAKYIRFGLVGDTAAGAPVTQVRVQYWADTTR